MARKDSRKTGGSTAQGVSTAGAVESRAIMGGDVVTPTIEGAAKSGRITGQSVPAAQGAITTVASKSSTDAQSSSQTPLSSADVAVAAYHIWLNEGCPHGRDHEHWQLAIRELTK